RSNSGGVCFISNLVLLEAVARRAGGGGVRVSRDYPPSLCGPYRVASTLCPAHSRNHPKGFKVGLLEQTGATARPLVDPRRIIGVLRQEVRNPLIQHIEPFRQDPEDPQRQRLGRPRVGAAEPLVLCVRQPQEPDVAGGDDRECRRRGPEEGGGAKRGRGAQV